MGARAIRDIRVFSLYSHHFKLDGYCFELSRLENARDDVRSVFYGGGSPKQSLYDTHQLCNMERPRHVVEHTRFGTQSRRRLVLSAVDSKITLTLLCGWREQRSSTHKLLFTEVDHRAQTQFQISSVVDVV